ncbi:MAG: methionyl-tRNA formyltransferase [Actinomycetota bacterium]
MRVVFMGTPEAAVPSLRTLARSFDVVGVYTRRDRPRGRGRKVSPLPVKEAATELGLQIVQPKSLRGEAGALRALEPDAIAVVAYGMILPAGVLDVPRLGCVNVHFSLLPRWRGAAPVERAILAGDESTGVVTMLMDPGLDTGPMLYREELDIGPNDTTGTLTRRLAEIAAPLLVRTLNDLDAGSVVPTPQDDAAATLAPKVEASEAELDTRRPAAELERRVRAMAPSPGAFLWFRGRRLKVLRATLAEGEGEEGSVVDAEGDVFAVQTTEGRLRLAEVQPEGKRPMAAGAYVRGHRPGVGEPIGPSATK